MPFRSFITAFVLGAVFQAQAIAQCDDLTTGPQVATLLGTVLLSGEPASSGDLVLATDASGQCVGSSAVILEGEASFVNLAIYGDDPTTAAVEGLVDGDQFFLNLYDSSEDLLLSLLDGQLNGTWFNTNGAPLPGWNDPYFLLDFAGPGYCPTDLDGNGTTGVPDLLSLLSAFGSTCGDCVQDISGDGTVEVSDLLHLLSAFALSC